MSGLLEIPHLNLPKATACTGCQVVHYPQPVRFPWHHIIPQEAGGPTTVGNLVAICDTGHYAVHALMHYAATHDGQLPRTGCTRGQRALALAGYRGALALGTVHQIPNEGGTV